MSGAKSAYGRGTARIRRDGGTRAMGGAGRGWVKGGLALLMVTALGLWQGGERRPTSAASGTGLFPAPAVSLAKSSSVEAGQASTAIVGTPQASTVPIAERTTIRIGTYNIHSGVGTDRLSDLSRIARVLRDEDIVGLNEVRGGSWLAPTSQSELLAAELQSQWLFAPTENQWGRGHFGNGIVSRRTASEWKRIPLAGSRSAGHRNVLIVTLTHPQKPLTVMITHLDRITDRASQLREITKMFLALPAPAVLLGDLNTRKDDPLLTPLLDADDVDDPLHGRLSEDPPDRIDWILTRGLHCVTAGMVEAGPSDHPHFWADFAWSEKSTEEAGNPTEDQIPELQIEPTDSKKSSDDDKPEQAQKLTDQKAGEPDRRSPQ